MVPADVVLAVTALAGAVALGTLAHELLHAACLWAAGVPYALRLGGGDGSGELGVGFGALASVHVERVPPSLSPWQLRVASLSPLVLAAPLVAIGIGAVPDPFAQGHLAPQLALIGWLACALPSPQDFSLVWYAERVVADRGTPGDADS